MAVITFLITGERELIFGLFIVYFLSKATADRANYAFALFYLFLIVGVAGLEITQGMKAALIGEINLERVMLENVFRGEFAAPGRNFHYLQYLSADDLVGLEVLVVEIQRFIFSFVPGLGSDSMSKWFNESFRYGIGVHGTSGWGFSMVGSGYLFARELGVIFYYLLIGLGLSLTIRAARKSSIFLLSYICIIPFVIYTTRQDLSYLLNFFFKYSFAFNIFLIVLARYLSVKYRRDSASRVAW